MPDGAENQIVIWDVLEQIARAAGYYVALLVLMRMAGKRLAGQTTTFDLLVLITLGVVLQTAALEKGVGNALVFVATVFALHRVNAVLCARSRKLRRLIRGAPRPLIKNGAVDHDALAEEGLSYEELLAGLRKLGHASPERVRVAILEETGHITAIAQTADAQS